MNLRFIVEQIINESQTNHNIEEVIEYGKQIIRKYIEDHRPYEQGTSDKDVKTNDNSSLQGCEQGNCKCNSERKELTELTKIEYDSLLESGKLPIYYPESTGNFNNDVGINEEYV